MKGNEPAACPACGDSKPELVDIILDGYHFGGRTLAQPISGGALFECNSCKLAFRYPRLTKLQADALYAETLIDHWEGNKENRPDWVIAARLIQANPDSKTILDFGCFDGQFLEFLGGSFNRHGIEIHSCASQRASEKGIRMVGKDITDLDHLTTQYDAAVAMDVIEHFENPKDFLKKLAAVVKPGGTILISTGNFSAAPWRLMRGMYWYCTLPEHLAFISPAWAHNVSHELGLSVTSTSRFSHTRDSLPKVVIHIAANLAYRYAYRSTLQLRQFVGSVLGKPAKPTSRLPPKWLGANDHFMVVFEKAR